MNEISLTSFDTFYNQSLGIISNSGSRAFGINNYYEAKGGFLKRPIAWVKSLFKRRKKQPPKHKEAHVQAHAVASREAYASPETRLSDYQGYKYRNDLSHDKRAVYHHPDKKHTIIAQRGTVLNDAEDLLDDALLASGHDLTKEKRFNDESKFIDDYKRQNPDHKVSVSGHSLAGEYVKLLGQKHGLETHAFNPGTSPHLNNVARNLGHALNPKINTYAVNTDIISTTDPFVKNRINKTKGLDSHSMNNFIGSGKIGDFLKRLAFDGFIGRPVQKLLGKNVLKILNKASYERMNPDTSGFIDIPSKPSMQNYQNFM